MLAKSWAFGLIGLGWRGRYGRDSVGRRDSALKGQQAIQELAISNLLEVCNEDPSQLSQRLTRIRKNRR